MSLDRLVAQAQRAETDEEVRLALRGLRKWLATAEGTEFLLSALAPPTRRWFLGRSTPAPVLKTDRVAAPVSMEPLGELRGDVVGCLESEMSAREKSLVDGEWLCWYDWCPATRMLSGADDISICVPADVPMRAAVFGLLSAESAVMMSMTEGGVCLE